MTEKNGNSPARFLAWLDIPPKRSRQFLTHLMAFFALVVIILFIDPAGFSPDVGEGQPCPKNILSPKAISFVDERKTNELRRIEEDKVEPVLNHLENAEGIMMGKFDRFMEDASTFFQAWKDKDTAALPETDIPGFFKGEKLLEQDQFREMLSLPRPEFERFKNNSRQLLVNFIQSVITDQNLEIVKNEVKKRAFTLPGGGVFKQLVADVVKNSLTVNAIVDEKQTKVKREAASKSVTPVKKSFQKGQKIIDEGVIVTADDIYVLKLIEKQIHKNRVLSLLGNILFAGFFILASVLHLKLTRHQILKDPEHYKLLAGFWIAALLLGKIAYTVGNAYDQPGMSILFSPLPTVGILMAILLDCNLALFSSTLLGILLFIVGEANAKFALVGLLGSIVGILSWGTSLREGNLRRSIGGSGLKVGFANSVILLALLLLDAENFSLMNLRTVAEYVGCGFANGVLTGILSNGVLPYIENVFSLATGSRLLELADLSQPLLKRLAEEAPGTYQHSIVVGNLAEAAANEINADALLAKIGAFFHDIGKLKRPNYFAENQKDKNQHDQLTPYMSSLILVGHIRDGMDLGRENGLPERVLSLMSQHHGTTLISYFYEQAKTDTEGQQVNEERFRYPGPKPQTKEAAIIMLADSVEAAARTLPQHTHPRIEGLVKKIIENKLNDENQLDESDLTLKDIEQIEKTFVKVLSSMYHGRVDYPGKLSNQPKGSPDGSPNQQPAKEN